MNKIVTYNNSDDENEQNLISQKYKITQTPNKVKEQISQKLESFQGDNWVQNKYKAQTKYDADGQMYKQTISFNIKRFN